MTLDEHLQVFVLEDLFSLPHAFVLNNALGTLLHLPMQPDTPHPVLLAEQHFTEQELSLVVPLLTNYPEFAPMEERYTSFCYGYDGLSEQRITYAREQVHEALEEGVWEQELRPLRNVLSRARFKLRHLGLDAVNLLETGSLLMANTRRKAHEEHPQSDHTQGLPVLTRNGETRMIYVDAIKHYLECKLPYQKGVFPYA